MLIALMESITGVVINRTKLIKPLPTHQALAFHSQLSFKTREKTIEVDVFRSRRFDVAKSFVRMFHNR